MSNFIKFSNVITELIKMIITKKTCLKKHIGMCIRIMIDCDAAENV